jgi:hypothetical protein
MPIACPFFVVVTHMDGEIGRVPTLAETGGVTQSAATLVILLLGQCRRTQRKGQYYGSYAKGFKSHQRYSYTTTSMLAKRTPASAINERKSLTSRSAGVAASIWRTEVHKTAQ